VSHTLVSQYTAQVNGPQLHAMFPPRSAIRVVLIALLVVVAVSRLAAIPDQPWEQDEALFAAAAFDTNVIEHRPHPPGFPLWVAAAKVTKVVLGDPVLGLQLLSALSSIALVPLLALLWGRLLGPELGLAASALFAFLPGVWFHAPRAFSTTPALALAALAGVLWLEPGRARLVGGSALLACAVLVRPVLAPPLMVAGMVAVWWRHDRWREIVLAGMLAGALIVAGFVPLIIDTGGLGPFLGALATHAAYQERGVGMVSWAVGRLGIVRAVGGLPAAVVLLGLGIAGWLDLARHRRRIAWGLAIVILITAAWLLLAHNRTYPRYAVPWLALWTGLAALGLHRLGGSRRLAVATVAALIVASAVWTLPAIATQATAVFPPLAALAFAQTPGAGRSIITDGGISPFVDLLTLARRGSLPTYWRPLLVDGRQDARTIPGPWTYVWAEGTRPALVSAPAPAPRTFRCGDPKLRYLSQQRYLTAWTAARGAIVLAPAGLTPAAGGRLAVTDEVELLTQPAPPGSWLGAVLSAVGRPTGVELELNGHAVLSTTVPPGAHAYRVPLMHLTAAGTDRAAVVRVLRTAAGTGQLELQHLWIDAPGRPDGPRTIPAKELPDGLGGLIDGGGLYGLEQLGEPARPARWSGPQAWLSLPAGFPSMTVALCAPRPGGAQVRLRTEPPGSELSVTVGPQWSTATLSLPRGTGRCVLYLEVSNPFVPAATNPASTDHRHLGIAVGDIRFQGP
jgi:hypothetical protein